MASKRKPKASKGEAQERPDPKRDLLQRIRDRYHVMVEADQENRRNGLADQRFVTVPGEQWDANMKKERGERPCYEFNKLRINGKRVINEIRANRPQGKVRAVEGGDKKTAELYEGLCRNIANMSDLDTITDNAAEYQVNVGMACWRVVRKYAADDVFDQDILIEGIKNPLCLWADPGCKDPLKRDAEDWILEDRISKEAYEAKYKGKAIADFAAEGGFDDQDQWTDQYTVRVVEYWYKEPYTKEIWLVEWTQDDGTKRTLAVDMTTDEADGVKADIASGIAQHLRTRVSECQRIKMCVASGDAILEEADEIGTQFPFVMVFGEYVVVEGKVQWHGLHRFSKDAQKSYNLNRTAGDEAVFAAAQAKWWATAAQAEGLTGQWSEAHKKNFPFMLYKPDPLSPGPPQRMMPPDVPIAFTHQAINAAQDVRDTSGLHEASFGEEGNEKSGVALARKQNQAQIVTYNFPDNMGKGVKRTWEILIDWIPHVYDAERELRVLGADGAEDYVKVNQVVQDPKTGNAIRVNDVTTGKYDVTITTGPSFSTMRQEAAEILPQIFPPDSPLFPFIADLMAKSMDYPFAEEMAKRLQLALPPQVQQMIAEGKDIPPEVQQAQAQVQQAMQMVQQQTQLVQQAAQEVQQDQAKSEKAKAEVEKALANLKTAEAQLEAKVAKIETQFIQREAQLGLKGAQLDGQQQQLQNQAQQTEQGVGELSEAKKAIAEIDAAVAQFMQAFAEAMQTIKAESGNTMQQMQSVLAEIKSKPKIKSVRMERVNGQPPRAVPEYEDQAVPAG
jgi:hypothetical protein